MKVSTRATRGRDNGRALVRFKLLENDGGNIQFFHSGETFAGSRDDEAAFREGVLSGRDRSFKPGYDGPFAESDECGMVAVIPAG